MQLKCVWKWLTYQLNASLEYIIYNIILNVTYVIERHCFKSQINFDVRKKQFVEIIYKITSNWCWNMYPFSEHLPSNSITIILGSLVPNTTTLIHAKTLNKKQLHVHAKSRAFKRSFYIYEEDQDQNWMNRIKYIHLLDSVCGKILGFNKQHLVACCVVQSISRENKCYSFDTANRYILVMWYDTTDVVLGL